MEGLLGLDEESESGKSIRGADDSRHLHWLRHYIPALEYCAKQEGQEGYEDRLTRTEAVESMESKTNGKSVSTYPYKTKPRKECNLRKKYLTTSRHRNIINIVMSEF